ncbi:hypothetical protein AWZ03_014789 [Drosophila navojoa]|uniref:Integrase catalytic domain-containing protein n=1 Tax=Drosophila navojoa TaxID=7232 RepID=A0A484ASE7_DRONA|nr:hypothetical protein AWZ03_014789 [Drosophila navojoa]
MFICDNGAQFASKGVRSFMESLGVQLQFTAPYSPRENPTERTNRTVKTMIAQYIEGHQSSWDVLLPEISLAINSSVADSTGFTPAFLMMGREPRLPSALYDEVTPGLATREVDLTTRKETMKEIFEVVRNNLQKKDQGRYYNLRRREWRPALGSMVLLWQYQLSSAAEGFAAKLTPKFDGPYRETEEEEGFDRPKSNMDTPLEE